MNHAHAPPAQSRPDNTPHDHNTTIERNVMKDWNTLDADRNLILGTHYTPGREGRRISKIVLHHNAGNLTGDGIYRTWQTREASAHYQVDASGSITQLVWDCDTAWHAGDWNTNLESIGIEHADISSNPWSVSAATLEAGAHLVAAICHHYNLGRPQWMANVFPHSHFSQTACPASLAGSQNAEYMRRAQEWYDAMTGGTTPPPATNAAPATNGGDLNALADAVIRGDYGNGDERRQRLGDKYDAVMAIVNQRYGITTAPAAPAASAGPNLEALADAVIRGDYGNGDERRQRLGGQYDAVMAIVNQRYGINAPAPAASVDIHALAQRAIAGEFGNGDARRAALGANYDAVQAEVNRILLG